LTGATSCRVPWPPGVRLSKAVTVSVCGMPPETSWSLSTRVGVVSSTPRLLHTAPTIVRGMPASTPMPVPPPPKYFSGTVPAGQPPVQGWVVVGANQNLARALFAIAPPSVPPFGNEPGAKLPAALVIGAPGLAGTVIRLMPSAGGVMGAATVEVIERKPAGTVTGEPTPPAELPTPEPTN